MGGMCTKLKPKKQPVTDMSKKPNFKEQEKKRNLEIILQPVSNQKKVYQDQFVRMRTSIRAIKRIQPPSRQLTLTQDFSKQAHQGILINKTFTSQQKLSLLHSLQNHPIFQKFSSDNLQKLLKVFKLYKFPANSLIYAQNDPGQSMFVVQSGLVKKGDEILQKGKIFGQLVIYHQLLRQQTASTLQPTSLWRLISPQFSQAIASSSQRRYGFLTSFIDSVSIFDSLKTEQKEHLIDLLVQYEYKPNEKIIIEGQRGDLFYVITSGQALITIKGKEIKTLKRGNYFGQQALMYDMPRNATITAISNVKVVTLQRKVIQGALGDQLSNILYKNTVFIAFMKSPVLKYLTKPQTEKIVESLVVGNYQKGETVIQSHTAKGEALWIVLRGQISNGPRTSFKLYKCIGDNQLAIIPRNYYQQAFVAACNSDVAFITREDFQSCLSASLESTITKNNLIQIFKRVPLFKSLPQYKIQELVNHLSIRKYLKNQVIFQAGDSGREFFVIKQGKVDVVKEEVVIRTIQAMNFFGQRAILLNEPRTAKCIASKNTILWVLNQDHFLTIIDYNIKEQLLNRILLQDDTIQLQNLNMVRLLGSGTFGNVYLTHNSTNGIQYALKTVSRAKISSYSLHDSLVLQRKVLLQIDHPFIVKLVKTFKDSNRVYFLLEYVRGKDLFEVLQILNLLTQKDSKFYTLCLVLILQHLHQRNIVYRDLKPQNVVIDQEGYPKMIDFGTSKIVHGRTFTMTGTPHYMAPEIISGQGYGLYVDC